MELTKGNFEELVFKKKGLTLVKFKTEWSGACQIISPLYFDLSRQYKGRVDFYFVDGDQEKQLSEKFGVMELPTILFFQKGLMIDHVMGLISRNALVSKIENALIQ